MEIRRLDTMLGKLEEKASQARQGVMKGMPGWKLEDIHAEIERAESRLKRLLSAGEGSSRVIANASSVEQQIETKEAP